MEWRERFLIEEQEKQGGQNRAMEDNTSLESCRSSIKKKKKEKKRITWTFI